MADPATIALVVKTAIAAASDKRTWKAVGVLIDAVLTPCILIIVMIMSLLSGMAQHSDSAVDLVFNGGSISAQVSAEYRQYIEDMRDSFSALDGAVSEITPQIESGSVDATRAKAIFYSLYFGAENLPMDKNDYQKFADAFVKYEKRIRNVTNKDGNKTQETYTVAVPISDLNEIYTNLESILDRIITEENKVNAAQIYSRVLYGHSLPENENVGEDEWKKGVGTDDVYTGGGNFASPIGANWRRESACRNVFLVCCAEENLSHLPDIRKAQEAADYVLQNYRGNSKQFGDELLSPDAVRRYYHYYFDLQKVHFEWNENQPDFVNDRNENKHYFIAKA